MRRSVSRFCESNKAGLVAVREEKIGEITFVGEKLVGKMIEEDLWVVGKAPKMFEGWNVRHEWGTGWAEVGFQKAGLNVKLVRHFENARQLPKLQRTPKSNRKLGLHSSSANVNPLGYTDSQLLDIYVTNDINWTMKITSWLREDVLILRDLVVYKEQPPTIGGEEGFRRYKGPALSSFDLVWGLFGGRGWGWVPPSPPSLPTLDLPEDKAVVAAATEYALRRSVYKNLTPADVAGERKQFTLHPPSLDPTLHSYSRHVTLPTHDPFVSLSPDATDTLYNFLDHLGVSDPNLLVVSDMAEYIRSLEAVRATHTLFDLFEAV